MLDLFEMVHGDLGGVPNGRGWYDATCPFCGKEYKERQTHFGYSGTSYRCFVCGAGGNLKELADHLRLDTREVKPVRRHDPVAAKPVARWRRNPDRLLEQYHSHPDLYGAWFSHKPLKRETVDRFGFGLGRLPYLRRGTEDDWYMDDHNRLIVPLYHDGQLVGIKGRAIEANDKGPKWISASGSLLPPFGLDSLKPGKVIWIVENYVDAAWMMQENPEFYAVGLGGVTNWKPSYSFEVARAKPKLVIVALDNDLPGQAQGELRKRLEAEWRADPNHKGQSPPASEAVKRVREFREMEVPVEMFDYGPQAPAKAGIDWILGR